MLQTLPEPRGHCREPVALPSWEDPSPDAQWPGYTGHTEEQADREGVMNIILHEQQYQGLYRNQLITV